MAQLIIDEPLASRIAEIAARDNVTPQEILATLFDHHFPEPRPATSLTDEDIDVPADVTDKVAYREAMRALAPKLYRVARRYWAKVGDGERLALGDEALDKQFWLIDQEGVPRLKSDAAQFQVAQDPLEALVGTLEANGRPD
jgi:hypothetical protein